MLISIYYLAWVCIGLGTAILHLEFLEWKRRRDEEDDES